MSGELQSGDRCGNFKQRKEIKQKKNAHNLTLNLIALIYLGTTKNRNTNTKGSVHNSGEKKKTTQKEEPTPPPPFFCFNFLFSRWKLVKLRDHQDCIYVCIFVCGCCVCFETVFLLA